MPCIISTLPIVDLEAYLAVLLLCPILGAGLFSTLLVRTSEGSNWRAWYQWQFFACLAIVGLLTMVSVALGAEHWLAFATTLAVMILAAVWDFGSHARAEYL
ncbi:MAG: hypothetical protein DWQ37_09295 [Planctomycetota bacterium]|nr:MAG: hypothetical protein DWQ37_09295 [Planctomycetota bacterium]